MNKLVEAGRSLVLLVFAWAFLTPSAGLGQPFAYISNYSDDTVSVIDTALGTVTKTVDVGDGPYGVAVLPDGSAAYIANVVGNSVSVIAAPSHTVVDTVSVGLGCYGVAAHPDGSEVYATSFGSGWLSVIDTYTNTNVGDYPVGTQPYMAAVHPDGSFVYVTNQGSQNVSVFDTSLRSVVDTVPLGFTPGPVAVNPDGSAVYVAGGGGITVIDTATNAVADYVPVADDVAGLAVHPQGSVVYVAGWLDAGDDLLAAIDTETNTYFDDEPAGEMPAGVSVHPDGDAVYVAGHVEDEVRVFKVFPFLESGTIDVGSGPEAYGHFVGPSRPEEIFSDGFESGGHSAWLVIPCGLAEGVRYADCRDGTVRDTQSNLRWLKDGSCSDLAGSDTEGRGDYDTAQSAAAVLADGLCGLRDGSQAGDWRIATKVEWESATADAVALECKHSTSPTLTNDQGDRCLRDGPSSFTDVLPELYWTSTDADPNAFLMVLWQGTTDLGSKSNTGHIWPVRWQ